MNLIDNIILSLEKEDIRQKNIYGNGFFCEPISESQKKEVTIYFENTVNLKINSDYMKLLEISNGMSVNGFNLYSAKEFMDENNEYIKYDETYFVYSSESTTRIAHHIKSDSFMILDRTTWEVLNVFPDFSSALKFNLEDCCILDV